MSKLNKEELLRWVAFWFMEELPPGNTDEEKQAYEQIKEIINEHEKDYLESTSDPPNNE